MLAEKAYVSIFLTPPPRFSISFTAQPLERVAYTFFCFLTPIHPSITAAPTEHYMSLVSSLLQLFKVA